ncbi:MAG: hypothetical protein QXO25_05500 [Candidatus Bathyarchaeia archaeon]
MRASTILGISVLVVLGIITVYWVWLFSMGITFWSTVSLMPYWMPLTGAIVVGILCLVYLATTRKRPK